MQGQCRIQKRNWICESGYIPASSSRPKKCKEDLKRYAFTLAGGVQQRNGKEKRGWGTLGFLAKIYFTPLLYHPGRCLGCPEKRTSLRNYNLFVWSAVFQPKWNDIQKSYKNYQNPLKSYCFLGYFQSLFNFGWKTAAQTN